MGIPLGVYTALKRDSWTAQAVLTTSLVGVSLPNFLIGIFLILIFAVWLGWLPSFGRGDTVQIGAWSTGFAHQVGTEGADPALDHAGLLSADAHHAARAR